MLLAKDLEPKVAGKLPETNDTDSVFFVDFGLSRLLPDNKEVVYSQTKVGPLK